VSDFDILSWDSGVTQSLNAQKVGDLVWVPIRSIEPIESTAFVYDFSVPGYENFLAGSGVFAHNTYGPRMRPNDGRVVSNFIVQALSGKPLTIFGDGAQTRSFCYVDELVEGITRLLLAPSDRSPEQRTDRQSFLFEKDVPAKRSVHEPINIGNPQELTVLEIAWKVRDLVGTASKPEFKPLPADDPKVRCPDISLARKLLGWEPKVSLDEGLRRTIEHFRKRPS
jgi:nucleoside-diphosphate-sugar epimerase